MAGISMGDPWRPQNIPPRSRFAIDCIRRKPQTHVARLERGINVLSFKTDQRVQFFTAPKMAPPLKPHCSVGNDLYRGPRSIDYCSAR